MSRTAARALAAFAALTAVLLGLLICAAAPGDTAVTTVAGAVADTGEPGCGPGHPVDAGAASPAVPPRVHGFGELLPALAGGRAVCGAGAPDAFVHDLVPGPEPPELVPPSPPELSVLRV